ncbi:integrase arm-type DNA-binding domain-containing protein [Geobacter sp. SVR]|uniref:tyrosine-type recombinase/integrase n=1 Tax=Geobacter sp. SVR TaxID=2495594 RepID=UPI00143EF9A0|nr:integrase arm-type DNA-binding domain-containing protein [Geobacter sp. SVR]BCS54739.1 integrase [Geobacter sp. SVR]GCF86453.1 integrase [Geobacter sp. SVR]
MPLTDAKVRNAKPSAKPVKLSDSAGMYLMVTPAGGKCWRLKYRFNGKEKTLALGMYPEVTLGDAREKRDAARKLLANDIDPGEQKKNRRAAASLASANTFESIALEWHEKFKHEWTEEHATRLLNRLKANAFPWIGARPITEIEAPDILSIMNRAEKRSLEVAHRVKTCCGQIFRYAIATGRAKRNPIPDLQGALPRVKNKHYAAPTDPKTVGPMLRAFEDYDGSAIVKAALLLAPLLFVRPGELRAAEWSEIDLDAAEWNIPAERMKMRVVHLVPLSSQTIEILKGLQPLTGRGRYVFTSHRSPLRCMSENAVNAALRRMGFERDEITGHGFRATARTILDEILGFRPDIIEHQLAHKVKDPNGRAYNRTAHIETRRKMMQTWADYLDELKAAGT